MGKKRKSTKGTSLKPRSVQLAVAELAGMGQNKSQISKELGLGWRTVDRILKAAELSNLVGVGKSRCHAMIPKSVENVGKAIDRGNLKASFGILRGTGVLKANGNGNGHVEDAGGINFTLAVVDARRADELLAALAKLGAPAAGQAGPALLAAEVHAHEG